jgi:Type IV secretion system pilin
MKTLFVLISFIFIMSPTLVTAAGLVPCGGIGEHPCDTFCYVILLIKNIANWLVIIFGIVAAITIMVAGLRLVLSVGDAAAKTSARRLITTALFGYILILGGWIIVGTFLNFLVPGSSYLAWSTIECEKK